MRILRSIVGGITAAAAGFAALQAQTAGTPLTLATSSAPAAISGSLYANAVPVTLTSGGNLSAGTFTVVGLDRRGNYLSEVITGPNINTVTGHFLFGTVTSITPNTTSATTVSAGWGGTNYGPWLISAYAEASGTAKAISGAPSLAVAVTTMNLLDPYIFQPNDVNAGNTGRLGNFPWAQQGLQTAIPWAMGSNLILPEDDGTWSGQEYAPTTFTSSTVGTGPAANDQIRLDPIVAYAWRLVINSTTGLAQLDVNHGRLV